ncbi:hypothetical protein EDC04DRAFT_2600356 [Pisolithus marmoratus]|nr:hypothetical protein EDC04DRAFT_2600356 [Pisolithus marmoratus]
MVILIIPGSKVIMAKRIFSSASSRIPIQLCHFITPNRDKVELLNQSNYKDQGYSGIEVFFPGTIVVWQLQANTCHRGLLTVSVKMEGSPHHPIQCKVPMCPRVFLVKMVDLALQMSSIIENDLALGLRGTAVEDEQVNNQYCHPPPAIVLHPSSTIPQVQPPPQIVQGHAPYPGHPQADYPLHYTSSVTCNPHIDYRYGQHFILPLLAQTTPRLRLSAVVPAVLPDKKQEHREVSMGYTNRLWCPASLDAPQQCCTIFGYGDWHGSQFIQNRKGCQAYFAREMGGLHERTQSHIAKSIKDMNGKHAIQKLIKCIISEWTGLINAFCGNIYDLPTPQYGCHIPEDQTRPYADKC